MKNIFIIVCVTIAMLFVFGALFDNAMADVTNTGATTNDQVNSTGSNTAITGGYESTSSTTYQSGSSSNTTSTSTTILILAIHVLYHQHLLQEYQPCRKTFVLWALGLEYRNL